MLFSEFDRLPPIGSLCNDLELSGSFDDGADAIAKKLMIIDEYHRSQVTYLFPRQRTTAEVIGPLDKP